MYQIGSVLADVRELDEHGSVMSFASMAGEEEPNLFNELEDVFKNEPSDRPAPMTDKTCVELKNMPPASPQVGRLKHSKAEWDLSRYYQKEKRCQIL